MRDKTIVMVLLSVVSLMLSIVPAFAFYHLGPIEDYMFENFGSRTDRILIKKYSSLASEIAALQAGEIDITDWPLTKPLLDTLLTDPEIAVLGHGGGTDYYTMNFNNNPSAYLGNPPNSDLPNPVYPNPCSVVAFRQALSHTMNPTVLATTCGGLYDPIYTPIPAYMAFWIHPDIRPGGALESLTYPYNISEASLILDVNHFPWIDQSNNYLGTQTVLTDNVNVGDRDFINVTSTQGFVIGDWAFFETTEGSGKQARRVNAIGVTEGKPYFNFTETILVAGYPTGSKITRMDTNLDATPRTQLVDAVTPTDATFINVTSTSGVAVGDNLLLERPDGSKLCLREIEAIGIADSKPYFNLTQTVGQDYAVGSKLTKATVDLVAARVTTLIDPVTASCFAYINVTSTDGFNQYDPVFISRPDGAEKHLKSIKAIGVVEGKPYFNFTEAVGSNYVAGDIVTRIVDVSDLTPTALLTEQAASGVKDYINVTSTNDFALNSWVRLEHVSQTQYLQIEAIGIVEGKPYFNFTEPLAQTFPINSEVTNVLVNAQTPTILTEALAPSDQNFINVTSTDSFSVGSWIKLERPDSTERRWRRISAIGVVENKAYVNLTETVGQSYAVGSRLTKAKIVTPPLLVVNTPFIGINRVAVSSADGCSIGDWVVIEGPGGSEPHMRRITDIEIDENDILAYLDFNEPLNYLYPIDSKIIRAAQTTQYVTETTLTEALGSGNNQITVLTPGGFAVNDWVIIQLPDGTGAWATKITGINGNRFVLDGSAGISYPAGSKLHRTDQSVLRPYRYWDLNGDVIYQPGEDLPQLRIFSGGDEFSFAALSQLMTGLTTLKINYVAQVISSSQAQVVVLENKDYHIYITHKMFIGPDPNYLCDYYSLDNYWHPGAPPNFGHIDSPIQYTCLAQLKQAPNVATALTAASTFQIDFAAMACEKPLASTSSPKAFNKWYTGGNNGVFVSPDDGENQYRGANWDDIVNQKGEGENSWWSTLNMYPVGHPLGDGTHLTVRYGWSVVDQPQIVNPLYSTSFWEWELLNQVYDRSGARDPYTLASPAIPQLMESWTQGTWLDPVDGVTKAAVTVTMKPALWNDGMPCTIDDFIYTLAQMPVELRAKGCTYTVWQPTFDQVAGYYKLDDYSAQILLKSNSFLAATWIVGNVVLPKHFWQPYIATNTPDIIQGDITPGNLVGTGPFIYVNNVPAVSVMLVRNPTYYNMNPIGVTQTFVATGDSRQISPNKIRPDMGGFGVGHLNVVITDKNEMMFNSVSYTKTVTIQKVAPTVGSITTLVSAAPHMLAAGASDTETLPVSLPKGEYEVVVTKTIISPAWLAGHVEISAEHVKLTVAGDLDGNWRVNILDIAPIAIRFGGERGDANSPPVPRYDGNADVNHDGHINILDIVQIALVFGWDP